MSATIENLDKEALEIATADKKILRDIFVCENLIRRECETRQRIADESFDQQILIEICGLDNLN